METHQHFNIETERLILRELNPAGYELIMSTLDDEKIKTFFGFTSDEEVVLEKERHKQGVTMAGRSFLYFHLIEKKTKSVLGWCGYHTWFTQHQRAEIGYVLNHDSSKGKGYMTEALLPIINYGFEKLELNRIEALIAPGNDPSLKLVKRLSFKEEGIMKEHYYKDKKFEDSIIFALLRNEIQL